MSNTQTYEQTKSTYNFRGTGRLHAINYKIEYDKSLNQRGTISIKQTSGAFVNCSSITIDIQDLRTLIASLESLVEFAEERGILEKEAPVEEPEPEPSEPSEPTTEDPGEVEG